MTTPTQALARHALDLRYEDIPLDVRRHAVKLITDAVGNGIYGVNTPQGNAVFSEARTRYREMNAPVWGRNVSFDAAGAALVNATQAHAFELDDYFPPGKTHPGAVIVPAALAVATDDTSGREFITAVVAAYDVMCRVALGIGPNSARARGFHMTGLSGPFGSAAVVGRLMGLEEGALTSALGIAASFSAGTFAFSSEGAMTKALHAGRAAEAGVIAARLAHQEFQGPRTALDASDGGLLNAVSDESQIDELTSGLGDRFDLSRVAIKPYPCCGSIHSSIDAIFQLQDQEGIAAADVDEVIVHNAGGVVMQCGFQYTGNGGLLEAQMSLQYCLAVALLDEKVGLSEFTEERRHDPTLLDLASRVTFVLDPELDSIYPRRFPARVSVRMKDGSTLEARVPAPLGSPENPIDDPALHAKFSYATEGVLTLEERDRLLLLMERLDSPAPIAEIKAALSQISWGSEGVAAAGAIDR